MTHKRLTISQFEFVALLAILTATAAFAIDGMLPALPAIGQELSPKEPNQAQLVLSLFLVGLSLGTFVSGPLADSWGRIPTALFGALLYCLGSVMAYHSQDITTILIARTIQGFGAAGPRIVSQAIIRDFYSGREMARLMSYVMIIFTLVPSFAPMLGGFITTSFGWRSIFAAFTIFGILGGVWLYLRVPEPLTRDNRIPINSTMLTRALRDIFGQRIARLAICALIFSYSALFTVLSMVQQTFQMVFDRSDIFVYVFASVSIFVGIASVLNAQIVMRHGMRSITRFAFLGGIGMSFVVLTLALWGYPTDLFGFGIFVIWLAVLFSMVGLTMGNLTALAMEPLGHIAGTAASIINSVATLGSALIATIIAQNFDGTLVPMSLGITVVTIAAYTFTRRI